MRLEPRTHSVTIAAAALLAALPLGARAEPAPIRLALIEGLSGSFANAGEAVHRNIAWAVERVNARGGVKLPGGARRLELLRLDSKGASEEALSMFRAAVDQGVGFVLQGNSSATAAALLDAVNKHNAREPGRQALFLNYSAVDPVLTNEKCSFWHFRFDAHADMRLAALMDVLAADRGVKRVYLIGQDYSFGQHVVRKSREMLAARRPDIEVVGEELHPLGRIKDFLPYASKIKLSGAQAVVTGNWGNDLTLLIRSAREAGLDAKFYTFYGNALGAPAAIGEAGVGKVLAVAEWHPNAGTASSDAFYASFRQRFPQPADDYVHARMQAMVELLVQSMEKAGSAEPARVARAMEGASYDGRTLGGFHSGRMRASDHQFIQPLYVSQMQRAGGDGTRFDNEGSGYGFKTVRYLTAQATEQPTNCRMQRP
ncbi:branched-chain amino acid ABC transporter substrate-binding protein [Aquabacterium sp. A7-Y]|uniref:branched-chain amino acid ABC transporter substrate-binding protein n=1 Tax=Aquabacterium sp. A7-Y TaxID=1349605 RepID=UPI00223D59B5|nr:branched-chain amino acid ABC transporter substrate-binding protein [Aquabacterium sp. A7-Y]MCW7538158.1 branched-chain amino acid ABC transporter substrate-binding protein [Aquabacterium sp. A7-Y]